MYYRCLPSGRRVFRRSAMLFMAVIALHSGQTQNINWEENKLNTAAASLYMQPEEREMIYEINRLRSDPPRYARLFIAGKLQEAKANLKENGKGIKNYSLTTSYTDNVKDKIDTTWHYSNEEMVNALQTLYDTLLRLKPLSILQPDKGIYKACEKHAADQAVNKEVNHRGNDGSWPEDRIRKFSPQMESSGENIAYNSGAATPQDIVLMLLIDDGIPGYGHRYNLLNAQWTHAACYYTKKPAWSAKWWIQNFGKKK